MTSKPWQKRPKHYSRNIVRALISFGARSVITATIKVRIDSSRNPLAVHLQIDSGRCELRPSSPLTETPPVSGPMKPTLTLSFASQVFSLSVKIQCADAMFTVHACEHRAVLTPFDSVRSHAFHCSHCAQGTMQHCGRKWLGTRPLPYGGPPGTRGSRTRPLGVKCGSLGLQNGNCG